MKKFTAPRILTAPGMEESDIRYATGLVASDPFGLIMDSKGHPHLIVSALEASRAQKTCPKATIYTRNSLFPDPTIEKSTLPNQILALTRLLGLKTVTVGPFFPIEIARTLENGGIKAQLTHAPAFPSRAIKTSSEIAYITASQRAAVAAMRIAVATIRTAQSAPRGLLKTNGKILTSEKIRNLIERTLLEHNCTATSTIVAIGPQSARPHDVGSGPLRTGTPIVIDIFPRNKTTGYWGDLTRTIVHGTATPEIRHMHKTVLAAQKLALSMIRPGAKSSIIQNEVGQFLADEGYPTRLTPPGQETGFIHSVGHGVGLDIHEAPGIRNEPGQLAAGHVVTVEPGLYIPGLGGIRIEDTIVVTPTGYKNLAHLTKNLEECEK